MLSDNHSGIIWTLACLIILTLSGVFLSILVDKKHGSSRTRNSILETLAEGERTIGNLSSELETLETRLAAADARVTRDAASVGAKGNLAMHLDASILGLRGKKAEILRSIPALGEEFDTYREKYRKQAWSDAAGEKIERLLLKSGRQFESVTITRVTALGLEISHPQGIARIDSEDLGREYRDRFQWDDEERKQVIAAERENRERLTREAPKVLPRPAPADETTSDADLEKNRSQVRALQTKVIQLEGSISTAESESRYASNRSVPGSLRTWAEQAALLKADLIRAEAQLTLAKERLRASSPGDPLLAPSPGTR